MRDDDDALVASFLEYRVAGGRVNRHYTECIDTLVDDILDNLDLLCSIGSCRALLISIDTGICSVLFDALIHAGKPAIRRILYYNGNLPILLGSLRCRVRCLNDAFRCGLRARARCCALRVSASACQSCTEQESQCHC